MFFCSIQKMNRLLSKGMSNIYFIILILKRLWHFQVKEFMPFVEQKYKL